MTTKPLETAWKQLDANEAKFMKLAAMPLWLVVFIDLVHQFQIGSFVAGISNVGMIAIISGLMVGPKCFGIIEAKPGSNSYKALAMTTLFGFLILVAGLAIKLLAYLR